MREAMYGWMTKYLKDEGDGSPIPEPEMTLEDPETLRCFRVHPDATKSDVKSAVEKIFKVKVADVRTANYLGKMRRRGKSFGYRPDWKKAYVKIKEGEKMVEYAEV
jgi:large subunit ribosomal protein L23